MFVENAGLAGESILSAVRSVTQLTVARLKDASGRVELSERWDEEAVESTARSKQRERCVRSSSGGYKESAQSRGESGTRKTRSGEDN